MNLLDYKIIIYRNNKFYKEENFTSFDGVRYFYKWSDVE